MSKSVYWEMTDSSDDADDCSNEELTGYYQDALQQLAAPDTITKTFKTSLQVLWTHFQTTPNITNSVKKQQIQTITNYYLAVFTTKYQQRDRDLIPDIKLQFGSLLRLYLNSAKPILKKVGFALLLAAGCAAIIGTVLLAATTLPIAAGISLTCVGGTGLGGGIFTTLFGRPNKPARHLHAISNIPESEVKIDRAAVY